VQQYVKKRASVTCSYAKSIIIIIMWIPVGRHWIRGWVGPEVPSGNWRPVFKSFAIPSTDRAVMVPSVLATKLLLLLLAMTVYFFQGPIYVFTLTQTVHYIYMLELNHFCNGYGNEKTNLYPVFWWLFLYKYLWFQSNSQVSDIWRLEVLTLVLMQIHFC